MSERSAGDSMSKRSSEASLVCLAAKRPCAREVIPAQISEVSATRGTSEAVRTPPQDKGPPRPCAVLLSARLPDQFGNEDFVRLYADNLNKLAAEAMSSFFAASVSLRSSHSQLADAWTRANQDGMIGLGSDHPEEIALFDASKDVFARTYFISQLQTLLWSAHLERSAALRRQAKAALNLLAARQKAPNGIE